MTFSTLDSALTGPLFRTDAMAAIFSDRYRLLTMLRAEEALARVEARHGLVPVALADALAAIDVSQFDLAALGQQTALSGVPVIPFVKAVQTMLPRELEPFFHFGATTQDIADTALALQMRAALILIAQDLRELISQLAQRAEQEQETPCIGRTYLQHAAPVTFGFKLASRLAQINQVAAHLPSLMQTALIASLGGPVGTLAALGDKGPVIASEFAQELKLAAAPIAMHTQRAPFVEIAAWHATLCGALGAWGGDIVHLASTEVAEVREAYVPGRGGSSAMPHKRNPVSATILVSAAASAPGLAATLMAAMIATHERPAGAWHAEWTILPQLFGLVSGALAEANRLAAGFEIDAAQMKANLALTRGMIFADAVSAALAATRGRAEAYRLVENAAHRVRAEAVSLHEALAAIGLNAEEMKSLDNAFRLEPSIKAAAQWVGPVVAQARAVHNDLSKLTKDA